MDELRLPDGIRDGFRRIGARVRLHARCVDCDAGAGLAADEPVVLASVVKVPLVLEFARQVAAGALDPTERVRIGAADRLGGSGTAGCADDVEASLRDLAHLALSISDNTAADVLVRHVGIDNVGSLLRELGLTRTRFIGGPATVLRTIMEDLGTPDTAAFAAAFAALSHDEARRLRALDPARTNASTATELTALLAMVWRDEVGADACALVRRLMSGQVNWHRLAAGFDDTVRVAAKSGSLPWVRNEIGVVSYPDGGRYAVAVCVRLDARSERRPDVDIEIGRAGRIAVDALRARCAHTGGGTPPVREKTTSHGAMPLD